LVVHRERFEAKDLVKAYRGRRVVDKVGLALERNEIIGLLGPRENNHLLHYDRSYKAG